MRGLIFYGDNKTEVKEFSMPVCGADQVVVQMKSSAICGSDKHFLEIPHDLLASGSCGSTGAGSPSFHYGVISGHEGAGVIYEIGADVKNVKVGDRVIIHHHQGCGVCTHCVNGEPMLCSSRVCCGAGINGTNAEYMSIAAKCCVKLPDEISFDVGAYLGCQVITAYSALRKLQVSGNEPLVIYGLGPLGMIAAIMARHMGAAVVGIDISEYRLQFAMENSICDYVINPKTEDCEAWLETFTKGVGVKKGLVACGAPQMHWLSSRAAAFKGVIVLIGVAEGAVDPTKNGGFTFDGRHFVRKELVIRGSYVMPMGMFEGLLHFLVDKKVNLDIMTTHVFDIKDGDEAFRLFNEGLTGKVVFQF